MKRAFAAVLSLLCATSGCYRISYIHAKEAEPEPRLTRWNHAVVDGFFVLSDPTRVDEVCPNGFARVENSVTVWNAAAELGAQVLLGSSLGATTGVGSGGGSAVALQIWSPSTVRVYCATKAAGVAPRPVLPRVKLEKPLKFSLLRLVARTGVSEDEAQLFADALVGALRNVENVTVVTREDLGALVDLEQQKQLTGCDDVSCAANLAGALGVDRVVHGSVGRIGESLVVTLSCVDPVRARNVASVSERLKSASNEAFFDALPALVAGLLNERATQ